jgi:hypothetical protein
MEKQDIEITNYVERLGYRLHDRGIVIKFPVQKKIPFVKSVQTVCRTQPACYSINIGKTFHGVKAAGV